MKTLQSLLIFSLIFLTCNCSSNDEEKISPEPDPFIEFSENDLSVHLKGEERKVLLTANVPWTIINVPEWITVSPMSGDNSMEITIKVVENENQMTRDTNLEFSNGKTKGILRITQSGLKDAVGKPSLPIFSFKYLQFTGEKDNYDITATNLFVNSGIKDRVYLGNLIAYDAGLPNTEIPEFTGYTFNPITISTSAIGSGVKSKTYIPSWSEQNAYAQEIIAKKPGQILSFIADNGTTEFYTYRRLYTLGIANLGIKLDEVVSGTSFTAKEMSKKYGLIFSFKQTLFSLDMDYPDKLIKEELKEADKAKGIAYVSSVFYGRVGLLVVETDNYYNDVRVAINKIISDKSLSTEEIDFLEGADISYVYFDNDNQVQVKRGTIDAVNAYKEAASKVDMDNIYPVGFGLSNFNDYSVNTISFSFDVPK